MQTPSDPDDHRRAWDAMPWVLAGTAGEADIRLLHRHLDHCADCRAEWHWQQQLQAGLQAAEPAATASAGTTDAAWSRMAARLDDDAANLPPPPGRAVAHTSRWLGAAVMLQAVALVGIAVAWWHGAEPAGQPAAYRTLSADSAPRASLRLVPAPGMDFATLQALLAQFRLEVVEIAADGRHLGLVSSDGDAATARAALPALRAQAGVLLAEPTADAGR